MKTKLRAGGRGTATDDSTWNAQEVMSWCMEQDDPASALRAVSGIEKTTGEPDQAQHWALPHHRRPGEPANAAAIRNARARFEQTEDLKDREAARRHIFNTHMLPSEESASDLIARQRERRSLYARSPGRWFEIKAEGDAAEIRIYDEIGWGGVTAGEFLGELDRLKASEITVAINSPGGDVFDGIAIYNALRNHAARVTTRVDGLAGSAASLVMQAGEHRAMFTSSQVMIHETWGVCIGDAAEMRAMADLLDFESDIAAGIYAERSGGDEAHFRELMRAETWMRAERAVQEGLADEIVVPQDQAPAQSVEELAEAFRERRATIDSLAERMAGLEARRG